MKRWLGCLVLAAVACPLLRADTIYQTNPQGKRVVIHRDAIVVKEDSYALIYKHFELRERRVVKVTLSQGSVPFTVATDRTNKIIAARLTYLVPILPVRESGDEPEAGYVSLSDMRRMPVPSRSSRNKGDGSLNRQGSYQKGFLFPAVGVSPKK